MSASIVHPSFLSAFQVQEGQFYPSVPVKDSREITSRPLLMAGRDFLDSVTRFTDSLRRLDEMTDDGIHVLPSLSDSSKLWNIALDDSSRHGFFAYEAPADPNASYEAFGEGIFRFEDELNIQGSYIDLRLDAKTSQPFELEIGRKVGNLMIAQAVNLNVGAPFETSRLILEIPLDVIGDFLENRGFSSFEKIKMPLVLSYLIYMDLIDAGHPYDGIKVIQRGRDGVTEETCVDPALTGGALESELIDLLAQSTQGYRLEFLQDLYVMAGKMVQPYELKVLPERKSVILEIYQDENYPLNLMSESPHFAKLVTAMHNRFLEGSGNDYVSGPLWDLSMI